MFDKSVIILVVSREILEGAVVDRNAAFIAIGYQLGTRWDRVEGWIEPIGYAVLAVIVAYLVWLAIRKLRSR